MLKLEIDLWQMGPGDIKYVTRWLNMIADDKLAIVAEMQRQQEAAKTAKELVGGEQPAVVLPPKKLKGNSVQPTVDNQESAR